MIKIFEEVLKLVSYLNLNTKKKFVFIIFVIFINSLLEFITIGAMVPFISFVSNPNKILEIELLRKTSEFLIFNKLNNYFSLYLFHFDNNIISGFIKIISIKKINDFGATLKIELGKNYIKKFYIKI